MWTSTVRERGIGAGVAWLLRRMGRPRVSVAVDGSVYKRHPRIQMLLHKYIALLAPHHPVRPMRLLKTNAKTKPNTFFYISASCVVVLTI